MEKNQSRLLLVVQDRTGHSENMISWDPKDAKQVESTQELFLTMKESGYMFFKVKKNLGGLIKSKGEQVVEFDPKLKKMIMEKNLDWVPVQEDNNQYEEAEWFDPETEKVEEETKYIASSPISGG